MSNESCPKDLSSGDSIIYLDPSSCGRDLD